MVLLLPEERNPNLTLI